MGDKVEARKTMIDSGVPVLPEVLTRLKLLKKPSNSLKKSVSCHYQSCCGGGGRGMRIVRKEEDLASNLELTQTEALAAFKTELFILKDISNVHAISKFKF